MKRPSKVEYYMEIAKAVSRRSTCLRRQYGAVLVNNDEIIGTGYNGSPRGKTNCCDIGKCQRGGRAHNDGDYRSCPAVHAEMNALLSVARHDAKGAVLYLYGGEDGLSINAEPCPVCKRLLMNAGISAWVTSKEGDK